MNERDLFLSALEIEDLPPVQAHLQSACAGDAALLARVESLLASHEGHSRFLQDTGGGTTREHPPLSGTAATLYVGNGSDTED